MDLTAGMALVFGLPLAGAAGLATAAGRRSRSYGWTAFVLSAAAALGAVALWGPARAAGALESRLVWARSLGLEFSFRVDALGLLLLVVVTALTSLAILYSIEYFREKGGASASFYAWMLLFMTGMAGVAVSADIIQFYVSWEFMLIPSAALVAFWGDGPRRAAAALKYFIFTHVGAVLLLIAILWMYGAGGTTDLYALKEALAGIDVGVLRIMAILLVIGFGVKLAIFPLHTWLPDTYASAPLPVGIALAGAMMSVGIYGLVRFVFTPFPAEVVTPLVVPLLVAAVVTQYYGGIMALVQKEMRRIVAYSSMSQMGYVLFGVATVAGLGVGGSIFHLLNHGLAKALLFMAIGAVVYRTGVESVDRLGGLASRMPLTALACTVGALSIAGAPPLSGFQSEWMIFAGGFSTGHYWLSGIAVAGGALTATYALWLVKRVFFGELRPELRGVGEAGGSLVGPMMALSLAALVVGIYPAPFVELIRDALSFIALSI